MDDSTGYFIHPTIISGLTSSHQVMQEEILAQKLASPNSITFNEAIDIANDTDYGLTERSSQQS